MQGNFTPDVIIYELFLSAVYCSIDIKAFSQLMQV